MKLGDAFPGNWLKSSDLGERDHVVTIEKVDSQLVGQGEDARLKLIVKFHEFPKPLICNLTNAKSIGRLCGEDTDDWPGKRVTLWVNPDVSFGSEVVEAVRVRSKAPTAPATSNGLLKYADAVALCASRGINETDLKNYLKQEGFTAYNSATCTEKVKQLVAGFEPVSADADDSDIPF